MTLIVDYGDHSEEYKHSVKTNSAKRAEHLAFCNASFKREHWHYYHFGDSIWFKRKKDLTWFNLKWL